MTDHGSIPDELKRREQWVCWREEMRDGEKTKVPVNPHTGSYASSTDRDTWESLEVARGYHEQADTDTSGVGFVFDSEGTIVGVDLDDVRDPETGKPTGEAKQIINDLDSWTEVSPSGTGYHVFAHGFVPDGGNRADIDDVSHIEMYDESRFFTVTGDHVSGTPETVENRAETVRDLHAEYVADEPEESNSGQSEPSEQTDVSLEDSELIEKAKGAENGDKFRRLWNGDTSGYPSHSEADQALCNLLAFWTGRDRSRIDRLFRRSGLMREKWDRDDYRERTVDNAVKGATEFYDPTSSTTESSRDAPTKPSKGDDNNVSLPWSSIQEWYGDSDLDTSEARYQAVIKLLEEHEFATIRDTQEIYVYYEPSGVFERGGEREIEHELQSGLGRHYSQHEKREILGHIRAKTYVDRDELNAGGFDEPLQCFGNCVLNVETREFYEHDPKYLFTQSIPWTYDPEAECPNLDSFMDDITQRGADKKTMYEMVGHSLHPDYIEKKFMILFGPGDNGKTVFYKFVRELLGGLENISAVQLQKMSDNRFAAETIIGSFANIAPDMDAKRVSDLGMLKTMTGGEDPVFVEPKGESGYEAVNTSTMMFGCNEPPVLPERGKKIETRIVPIELPYEFVPDPDPDAPLQKQRVPSAQLTDEIVTEEEMSGFINKALDGLDRLTESHDVSLPETPAERLELYEQHSDPIKKFAIKCLEQEAGCTIPKDDVYNVYSEFCRQNDVKVVSRNIFFRKLRQTTFPVSETQPRAHGKKRCLDGAAFTEYAEQYAEGVIIDPIELDDDEQTASTRHDPVSLLDVATDPTGYPTVEGEVATVDFPEGEDSPALKAALVDNSTAVDVVSWDDGNCLEHGERVIIENADTSEFNGATQLVVKPGVTTVHEAPDDGQTQIDSPKAKATDGGDDNTEKNTDADETDDTSGESDSGDSGQENGGGGVEDTNTKGDNDGTDSLEGEPLGAPIVHYIRENQKGRDGVPEAELIEHLTGRGAAEKTIDYWIDKLLTERGDISEPSERIYRV